MDLKFNNGKFVILQVSDPQDLQWVRGAMVKMLDRAYDRVKPDLVIFTGDNILGNHLKDARFGTRVTAKTPEAEFERMRAAIGHIVRPVEKRHIPFTMIYGNHDDMNRFTKEEQADIYRSYSMCAGVNGTEESGDAATFNIPLYSSDGRKKIYNLWCIDSGRMDKTDGKCHTSVTKEAVEWYEKKSAVLKKENGGVPLPSLMFQHIPLCEAVRLTVECGKNDEGAIPEHRGSDRYIRLDPEKAHGFLGEGISACRDNFGQFEAMKRAGDIRAVVFGHDHVNCFEGELDGIRVVQTPAASFRCYGNRLRGVRVFVLDENDTSHFGTYVLTYADLCGRGPLAELRYIWDADGEQVKKGVLIAGVSVLTLTAAALTGRRIIHGTD